MIYLEVNFSMFCDQFHRMGRKDQFSYEGKKALWEYLDSLYPNEDMNESWELDVITLCCDWAEYTEEDFIREYGQDSSESLEELKNRINDITPLLETDIGTYLLQAF